MLIPSHSDRQHVALKLFFLATSMGKQLDDETYIYNRMAEAAKRGHPAALPSAASRLF